MYEDGHYNNGHYYNKIKLPIKGTGEYKKVGATKIGKHQIDVVDWTGKEKEIEYWECNECFDEASHKLWLEEALEKLYGKMSEIFIIYWKLQKFPSSDMRVS